MSFNVKIRKKHSSLSFQSQTQSSRASQLKKVEVVKKPRSFHPSGLIAKKHLVGICRRSMMPNSFE